MDEELIERLKIMPAEELLATLREVFRCRQPNPEENEYNRNCYFLGTASSLLDENDGILSWDPWEIEAVAYVDFDEYGHTLGPDYGFCQFGTCNACQINVRSNVKHGICPICGSKVYMT